MKKCILFWLGLMVATFSQAEENRALAVASAGDVDPALVEHLRNYLEENSGVVVSLAPAVPMEPEQSLEAIGRAAAKTLGKNDPGIIVLARPTNDQPQGVCLPWERFAALNVARLEVGADAAHLERRAGQEGLRVMAMLLGMSPCPFPRCVLVGYEKVEDLDRMSGNFCPPCLSRFTRIAQEAGLRLVETDEPPAVEPLAEPAQESVVEPVVEPAAAP